MSEPIAETYVRLRPDLDPNAFKASAREALRATDAGFRSAGGVGGVGPDGSGAAAAAAAGASKKASGVSSLVGGLGLAKIAGITGGATIGILGVSAAVTALKASLRSIVVGGANFETEMNTFQAVSGATAAQMDAAGDAAIRLGADLTLPNVSAADAATALTELAKGGLTVQDSMAGAKGVLQLATAGMLDNATAAGVVAQNLNAFGLAGDQAVHVADLLAGASVAATGEVSDMAIALQQSAAVAKQVGLSVDDTVVAIAALAKNGLLGSDAGTSLRTTLLRLIPSTKKQFEAMRSLGVAVLDTKQNLLPLPQIFENYRLSLSKLTKAQQQQALTAIFGQDAIRAASIFAREGAAGFENLAATVTKQGSAADLAAARTKGLTGSYNALRSNLETIAVKISGRTNPAIKSLVDLTNAALTSAQENWPAIQAAVEPVVDGIREAIQTTVELGTAIWDRFGEEITEISRTYFGLVLRTVGRVFEQIGNIFATITDVIHGDWNEAWSGLKDIAKTGIEGVKDILLSSGKILLTVGRTLGNFILEGFQQAMLALEELALRGVEKVLSIVAKIPTSFEGPFGKRIGIANPAKGALAEVRELLDGLRDRRAASEFADAIADNTAAALAAKNRDITQAVDAALLSPAAAADVAGETVAKKYVKAVKETIVADTGVSSALDSIRARLAAAIEQTAIDVRNAVLGAQRNLSTLSSGLAQQLGEIIDDGTISKHISRLEDQLSGRQARTQSLGLRDQIKAAKKELRDARNAIGNVGLLTPAQRVEVAAFLLPKRQALAAARTANVDFQKQTVLAALNKRKELEKTGATRRLAALTDEFNAGKIGFGEFSKAVARLLRTHDADYKTAGQAGGTAFATGFNQQVAALLLQGKEIDKGRKAGLPALAGAGSKPEVVKPLTVLNTSLGVQKEIRDELRKANAREAAAAAKVAAAAAKKAAKPKGGPIDLTALIDTGSSS